MAPPWPRRAVVDIGSNSVRLVIFSGPPRVPVPITNEKALCGLGRRDEVTGNLREDAVSSALETLRRFYRLIETEEPETLDVFATAATREAPNGPAFIEAVRSIGFEPKVLSGEEEARLAGLGILCSAPEIRREGSVSIGGDLGGGSLELSLLGDAGQEVSHMVSLPLGALRLQSDYGHDRQGAEHAITMMLEELDWLSGLAAPNLYIVGGSWRAIARVGMYLAEHPVPILDHYAMAGEQAMEVCRFVEEADDDTLGDISGVQKKRVPTLSMASIVLRRLIERSRAERVIVSACGVREGLLFDRLTARIRAEEPLQALSKDMAARNAGGRIPNGRSVAAFFDGLFENEETEAERRLRYAAATMIRMGNLVHPDRRAAHAGAMVMAASFLGIDHMERSMLAVMVKTRYNGSIGKSDPVIPLDVLSSAQKDYAIAVGRAHRLAATIRTPLFSSRSGFRLTREGETMTLTYQTKVAELMTDMAAKDLERLGEALGLESRYLAA